jgi:hypothetical protein
MVPNHAFDGVDMAEKFTSQYIVQIKAGHPGHIDHQVISTASGIGDLVNQLQSALWSLSGDEPAGKEKLLASHYATEAHGRSERVYLSFYVASDLADYHRMSLRNRFTPTFLPLLVAAVMIFATVSVIATGAWLRSAAGYH